MQSLQIKLLNAVAESYPKHSQAVTDLCALLNIGRDGAYRRFRDKTALHISEIELLVKTYSISMDRLLYDDVENIIFSFDAIKNPISDYWQWFEPIAEDLKSVRAAPESSFTYISSEILIFYQLMAPELLSFKLFTWGTTIWELPWLQNKKYEIEYLDPDLPARIKSMAEDYIQIKSTEIINTGFLDNTIKQIKYFLQIGKFKKPKQAFKLMDYLRDLIIHLERMAEEGFKFLPDTNPVVSNAGLELYYDEMLHSNNTIFVQTAVGNAIYTNYDTPNFIKSVDSALLKHSDQWLEKVIRQSIPLHGNNERNRKWFFNQLHKKIEHANKEIEVIIESNSMVRA